MSREDLEKKCFEAFDEGNRQNVELLLPQIRQPAKVRDNVLKSSLLHYAAQHGWLDVVVELATKYKCDVNCKNMNGFTPLHYATNIDQLELMKYLINEQHCDPMTKDNDHRTPLHWACATASPTTLSVRHTVTHHLRIKMVIHHSIRLVASVTLILCNTYYLLVK